MGSLKCGGDAKVLALESLRMKVKKHLLRMVHLCGQ